VETTDDRPELPSALDYLQLARAQEDRCDATTRLRLPFLGEKAPALVVELGMLLSWLDRAGSCWWGCAKGDHLIEHIIGGSSGTCRAGLRLAFLGFYDEALSLSRFLGERANLLALFADDPALMDRWRQADEKARRREFSAVRIRLALENLATTIPTPEDRYRQLSSFGSHPGRTPQHHDPKKPPRQGGAYDEAGLLLSLNELARGIVLVGGLATPLLVGESIPRLEIIDAATQTAKQIGGVNVSSIDDLWKRDDPDSSQADS
jgi:hypothetical protein